MHHVLPEKINDLIQVQGAGAIGVEFSEDGFDNLILFDFLIAHQVLFLHVWDFGSALLVVFGYFAGWLSELAELHLVLQPILDLVGLQHLVLCEDAFELWFRLQFGYSREVDWTIKLLLGSHSRCHLWRHHGHLIVGRQALKLRFVHRSHKRGQSGLLSRHSLVIR